ncbi:MAG: hypothetical protein HY613_11570 [Candidatus Rokubacteria bacterium]|nr:hypothetical protein [Candidatus Rokubacteria bacterium]
MAFFDLPSDEELSPEVRQMLQDYARLTGKEAPPPTWRAFARSPKIVEARLKAAQNIGFHLPGFSWDAEMFALMLIAHAKRCQTCFGASRLELDKLGFDETTLDGICANPGMLPLKGRNRLFVEYALKVATDSVDLKPKDFREMEAKGFSKDEIQQIIAFAAYWTMHIVFTQSMYAALAEE